MLLSVPVFVNAVAQTPVSTPVTERVDAQNKLFDEYFENGLRENPERATAIGDYRYNALLGDESLAAVARQHATAMAFEQRLRAIPTDGMGEQDLLSHQLLLRSYF